MFKQSLPTYIHNFEHDPRWKNFSSPHYTFKYFNASEAEKDIKNIVDTQEASYKKIMEFTGLEDPKHPIEYFFYPDAGIKKSLMGDDWYAQAIYDEFRIHVLYTAKDKPLGEHEDTHLLTLPWGLSIGIFQEGLAEFMVGHAWDCKSHKEYVKDGYSKGLYSSLSTFMDHKSWLDTDDNNPLYYYSLAGAFTAFLVEKYGKDKFIDIYKKTNRDLSSEENTKIFESVYGSINEIEQKFKINVGFVER